MAARFSPTPSAPVRLGAADPVERWGQLTLEGNLALERGEHIKARQSYGEALAIAEELMVAGARAHDARSARFAPTLYGISCNDIIALARQQGDGLTAGIFLCKLAGGYLSVMESAEAPVSLRTRCLLHSRVASVALCTYFEERGMWDAAETYSARANAAFFSLQALQSNAPPALPSLPAELPSLQLPELQLPELQLPELQLPELQLPEQLPELQLPESPLPEQLPELQLPELPLPEQLPELQLPEPSPPAELPSPLPRELQPPEPSPLAELGLPPPEPSPRLPELPSPPRPRIPRPAPPDAPLPAVEPAAASVEPTASSVEPAPFGVEPAAASIEPAAASVEPPASDVELLLPSLDAPFLPFPPRAAPTLEEGQAQLHLAPSGELPPELRPSLWSDAVPALDLSPPQPPPRKTWAARLLDWAARPFRRSPRSSLPPFGTSST
jgi:hypothetical protein